VEAAAARLFAAHGYAATRLDDVAIAAGVTKPILYRHYASKKALYLEILERHREEQRKAADAVAGALLSSLPRAVEAWFRGVEEHPEAWRMIFRDRTGDAEISAARTEAQESARALIATTLGSLAGGAFAPVERAPAAELLRSAMAGLALWSMDHPDCPRMVLVDLVVRVARGLVVPSAEAAADGEMP
jgi:AcrR family transcriptional regulator